MTESLAQDLQGHAASNGRGASAEPLRLPYLPSLDGIRGIALLVMLLYHGHFTWVSGGYLSVSTFFTLSGFLITSLLLIELRTQGRIDLARFWARRFRRLLPAAILGVAFATLYTGVAGSLSQLGRLRVDALGSLFYFANWRFLQTGHSYWEIFSRPSALQHYWSLSIEEQFYVVYPLIVIGLCVVARRSQSTLRSVISGLAIASVCAGFGLVAAGASPARLYYGTDTRAAEFLLGALLAAWILRDGRISPIRSRLADGLSVAGLVVVAAHLVLVEQDSAYLYSGGFAVYALGTTAIVHGAVKGGWLERGLSLPPFPWVGRVSYGAYVFHWPVFLWLDEEVTGFGDVPLLAVRVGVTFALAALSYYAIEQPVRRGGSLLRLRGPALAVPALLGVLAALGFVTRDLAVPDEVHLDAWRPPPMPELRPRAPEGPVRIMVFGDSVGWNLGGGLERWASLHPDEVVVWNMGSFGCGIARGGKRPRVRRKADDLARCDSWSDWWEIEVDRFRPDVVIVVVGLWDLIDRQQPGWPDVLAPGDPIFDDWLVSEYQLAADILGSRGAHVVWLTAPCAGEIPRVSPFGTLSADKDERIRHLNESILPRLVASRPGRVSGWDLFAKVCPRGVHETKVGPFESFRTDFIHISHGGTIWIAKQLAPEAMRRAGFAFDAGRD